MLERTKESRDYNDYKKIFTYVFLSTSFNFNNYTKVLLNDKNFFLIYVNLFNEYINTIKIQYTNIFCSHCKSIIN